MHRRIVPDADGDANFEGPSTGATSSPAGSKSRFPSMLVVYVLAGTAFVVVGIAHLAAGQSVVTVTADYTDRPVPGLHMLTVTVPETMRPPIHVYYQLDNFFQNHRRYIGSKWEKQFAANTAGSEEGLDVRVAEKSCSPLFECGANEPYGPSAYYDSTPGCSKYVLYPCGLMPASMFNDSFVVRRASTGERVPIDEQPSTIAWEADVSSRFENLDPEKLLADPNDKAVKRPAAEVLDMWLLRREPPKICEPIDWDSAQQRYDSEGKGWPFPRPNVRETTTGVRTIECTGYNSEGGGPTCTFDSPCTAAEGFVEKPNPSGWGLLNGHFLVWVRNAGLPSFWKYWGRIDEELAAGTELKVHVQSQFPVTHIGGKPLGVKKALVLSTQSWAGGPEAWIIGVGYVFVGVLALCFGLMQTIWYVRLSR